MSGPKILIFTPIAEHKEYCLKDFIENCKKFTYKNIQHIFVDNSQSNKFVKKLNDEYGVEAYWVQRGANSREGLARSQVFARKMFLNEGYDYLLSLESDIFPPEDFIERLLRRYKPVITGLYMIGDKSKGIQIPCITLPKFNEDLGAKGTRLLTLSELPAFENAGVQRVAAGGMGCCLMRRDVIEKVSFYYDSRYMSHSDVYFFNKCNNIGIPVHVDTDLYCRHENSQWETVKDR